LNLLGIVMAGFVPAIDISFRHCEQRDAIQKATKEELDCFVASLLAMT
jgi:hypothetical protein